MTNTKMENIVDTAKVAGANAAALGIGFSDIENGLKLISLILAIGYTVWKFRSDVKKKNKAKNCNSDCGCHDE